MVRDFCLILIFSIISRKECKWTITGRDISSARVGHTAQCLEDDAALEDGNVNWLLFAGGANLSSCCPNYLPDNLNKGYVIQLSLPTATPNDHLPRYEQASGVIGNEVFRLEIYLQIKFLIRRFLEAYIIFLPGRYFWWSNFRNTSGQHIALKN